MPANSLNLPDFKAQQVGEADHDYHAYAEVSNPPGVCTPRRPGRLSARSAGAGGLYCLRDVANYVNLDTAAAAAQPQDDNHP